MNKVPKVVLTITCILVLALEFAVAGCSPGPVPPPASGPADEEGLSSYQLEIDLLGEKDEFPLDSKGALESKVQFSSADGRISLSLDKGATALDKDGKALQTVCAAIAPSPPPPSENAYIIGSAYKLDPQGAEFYPWLKLTLSYESDKLPEGVTDNELYVACYSSGEWYKPRYKQVDAEAHSITTQVSHFSTFAILGPREIATSEPSTPVQGTWTGNLAPDFHLPNLDGQIVSLSGFQGKPVLLNFWSTRCSPCCDEMPYLQEIHDDWSSKGLILVAVNLGEDSARVEDFMQSHNLSLPVLLDTTQSVSSEYNIGYIPATFLIDDRGIVQAMKVGAFSSKAEIEGFLASIIP